MIDIQDHDDNFSSIFEAKSVTADEAAASIERATQALDRFAQAVQSLTTLDDDFDGDDIE